MAFGSLGSAFSPTNFRDIIGNITGNAIFGRWSVVKSAIKKDVFADFTWNTIRQVVLDSDAIAEFDAFMSFSQKKQNTITDYPIEGGGFVSAMKVIKPTEYEVVLVKNGMNFNFAMESFLDKLNKYRDGTELVDIITPSKTYTGCNIESSDYQHLKDRYSGMLVVKLGIKEIMNGKVGFSEKGKVRGAASASVIDLGNAPMTMIERANISSNAVGGI